MDAVETLLSMRERAVSMHDSDEWSNSEHSFPASPCSMTSAVEEESNSSFMSDTSNSAERKESTLAKVTTTDEH